MHPVVRRLVTLAAAAALASCGEGNEVASGDYPVLVGKLAYVVRASSKDTLYLASDSGGSNAHELIITGIQTLPPHDVGSSNLQPSQIESIEQPVWSHDGGKLALVVSRGSGQSQIIVVEPQTGMATTASLQSGEVRNPDWSPDGTQIAYVSSDPGFANPRLTITDVATGTVTDLSSTVGLELTAHRWDAQSNGIYYFIATSEGCAFFRVAVPSQSTECVVAPSKLDSPGYEASLPQDLTRDGGDVYGNMDPEFTALYFRNAGSMVADGVRFGAGLFYGWFLEPSDSYLGVEEITNGGRNPPLIAHLIAGNPTAVQFYRVNAPLAQKWDFYKG